MNLSSKIESILFFKGEAVSTKQLSDILGVGKDEIEKNLVFLKERLDDTGIRLVVNEDKVMLGTSPETYEIIEKLRKEELSKDLGKASLETLSIVLYRGPIRKSEIDYIRGVNSATILRSLLVRGLIEKKNDEKNQRSFLYIPTLELISFLGISSLEELPEFGKVKKEMEIKEEEKVGDENDENEVSE
ncbi:SMC-Scp complex subunit ScpB [Patescibacteria group bacterium]|nr:SMC-Scp complex subunit ScpB [Patescibacteria group bacterium]MCG2695221.1 SMC-Scp complex subunit ScpB [Candidatus Parcubacteria bacterium]